MVPTFIPVAFEQPCHSLKKIDAVRDRVQHPVYLDESTEDVLTILDLLGQGRCDGLGMKLTRVCGLSPMLTVRDMAEARRVPMSVDDSWGGDIIAAACVHMGSTVLSQYFRGSWIAAPYIERHYDPDNGVRIVDGHIAVPDGIGLGLTIDAGQFGEPVAVFD